ncbi:hypothetical protein BDV29DRAFT_134985 [Aspergillus leporis]|uniref:Mid2 domain-containing protein n=1 Tax=Aspergillus leporis TaxID=41062 RepID=A0A5N5WYH7_9EURO|nr:hypothetical protein BDV29DRAFT_134985 [Aspergillus leporis]
MLLAGMFRQKTSFLLLVQAARFPLVPAAQCYWNDGVAAINEYQPCFPDQAHSACCGLNKLNDQPNDMCTTSGLCYVQVKPYTGHLMLNPCTDQSWGSSDCPQICPNSLKTDSGIWILPCPSNGKDRWCCSGDGSDCCANDFKLDIGKLLLPTSSNSSTSPSENTTIVATMTITANANSQATSFGECSANSKITAVGAGVGAGLGACLVTTAAALWFQRRLHRKRLQELKELRGEYTNFVHQNGPTVAEGPVELPLNNKPLVYELGGGHLR